jgi:hypothetical protein
MEILACGNTRIKKENVLEISNLSTMTSINAAANKKQQKSLK